VYRPLGVLLVAFLSSGTAGHAAIEAIPVVTVCDVLGDLAKYQNRNIIVVGRKVSTREGSWLGADCGRKLLTNGYVWPELLSLFYIPRETKAPPRLPEGFSWNTNLIDAKLQEIQRTTKLRSPPENDRWEAIFGRLETRLPLRTSRNGRGDLYGLGYGHMGMAPAALVPTWKSRCSFRSRPKLR
jgi:hypothetical protein